MEGGYRGAIIRMGKATLGAFRSTPLGLVAAQSGLTPARALLEHRQARFTQRLCARPKGGDGSDEILTRERAALTARLGAASSIRPRETVEAQEWGVHIFFPGKIAGEGPSDCQ